MKIKIASETYDVVRTAGPIVRQGVRKVGEVDWSGRRLMVDGELAGGAAWEAFAHEVLEAFELHLPPPEDREKRVDWAGTVKRMAAEAMADFSIDKLLALPADAAPALSPPVTSDARLLTTKFAHLTPDQFEIVKHLYTKYELDPWDNDFHVELVPTKSGLEPRLCLHQKAIEDRARASDKWAGCDKPHFDFEGGGDLPTSCTITVYRLVDGQRQPFTGTVYWNECFGHDVEQLPEVVREKPMTCLEARCLVKILRRTFGLPFYLKAEFVPAGGERQRQARPTVEPKADGPQSSVGMHGLLSEKYGLTEPQRKKLIAKTSLTFGQREDGDEVRFYAAVIAAAEAAKATR